MNHVGPPQPPLHRRPGRSSSVTADSRSAAGVPLGGGGGFGGRKPRHRRSLQWSVGAGGVDDVGWTEVDGAPTAADAAATEKPSSSSEETAEAQTAAEDKPSLAARPSLRIRRNFDCPDLMIINRNPSAQDVATACTPHVDPVVAPPTSQHRPPMSFLSSAAAAPSAASRLPRRRLTLPGIIKYDPSVTRASSSSRTRSATPTEPLPAEYIVPAVAASSTVDETPSPVAATPTDGASAPHVEAGFGVRAGRPAAEMYLVENCARKRLQEDQISEAEVAAAVEGRPTTAVAPILDMPSLDGLDPPKPLAMRYRQVL